MMENRMLTRVEFSAKFKEIFGSPLHTIRRTTAPDTSIAAAYSVDTKGDERKVFAHFVNAYPKGLTLNDLEKLMGKSKNTFSGRVSSLLGKRMVEDTKERRERCRVIRMTTI
jgi:hypothetical protein